MVDTAKRTRNKLDEKERLRLLKMSQFEEEAYKKGYKIVAGCDEAGCGPLAGPVVAAACILPRGIVIPKMNDSKKLTPAIREELHHFIVNDSRISYGIGIVEVDEIDRINIYHASLLAMKIAVENLKIAPDFLLVDGRPLTQVGIPSLKIVKGDQLSICIASASVIAKVERDRIMQKYDLEWPHYGFAQHKGYATRQHLDAIDLHGRCPLHRKSFKPVSIIHECEYDLC